MPIPTLPFSKILKILVEVATEKREEIVVVPIATLPLARIFPPTVRLPEKAAFFQRVEGVKPTE